jgi:hypothetical protein
MEYLSVILLWITRMKYVAQKVKVLLYPVLSDFPRNIAFARLRGFARVSFW